MSQLRAIGVLFCILAAIWSGAAFAERAVVVLYEPHCHGYFIADGSRGYFLLEWYGGYDPSVGDLIVGEIASYGFKDVYYPRRDREGRIYVDDYDLSKSRVLEKYREKCN